MQRFPPTIRDPAILALLGDCLAVAPAPGGLARLRARLFSTPAPWQDLIDLADSYGLLPALAAALDGQGLVPPAPRALPAEGDRIPVAERLRRADAVHRSRTAGLQCTLDRAVAVLNEARIVPLLLKGAVALWDGAPAWRAMRDIDLLVEAAEIERAMAALLAIGFRADPAPGLAEHHAPPLRADDAPGAVELHHQALAAAGEAVLPTAALRRDALALERGGLRAMRLRPVRHLLHGVANHRISDRGLARRLLDLKGLYEFAAAAAALDLPAWAELRREAAAHPLLQRAVEAWLAGAADLFRLELPNDWPLPAQAIADHRAAMAMARRSYGYRRSRFLVDELAVAYSREKIAARYGAERGAALWAARVRHTLRLLRKYRSGLAARLRG